jgi:hypothetical protein
MTLSPTGIERVGKTLLGEIEEAIQLGYKNLSWTSPGKSEPYLRVSVSAANEAKQNDP